MYSVTLPWVGLGDYDSRAWASRVVSGCVTYGRYYCFPAMGLYIDEPTYEVPC